MKIQIEPTVESEVWPVKVLGMVGVRLAHRSGHVLLSFLVIVALIVSGCPSPLHAAPASELDWQWRNPLPGNSDLNAVVFAQERFVAVGDTGTLLVSRDGETWERSESPTAVPLYGVAYRYGRFVVVGGEWAKGYSVSLVSTDGLFWGLSKVGDGNQLCGVTYGNDLFVAIGNSWTGDLGVVYTSVDGVTWTLQKSGVPTLRDVMFDGDRFVVVGEQGTFLCSTDGVDWVRTAARVEIDSVAYGAGKYLGVGGASIVEPLAFSSVDLQDWTPDPLPADAACLKAVAYVGGHFVSVGYAGTVLTSADGLAWARQDSGIESTLNDVTFGNGQFVAVGDEGAIISSPGPSEAVDGPLAGSPAWPWTLRVAGTRLFLHGVTYGNGIFVALGSKGRIVTSRDGVNWTSAEETTALAPWSFTGVEYGNGVFVATAMYYGFTPGVFTSKDGVYWEPVGPYPGPPYGVMDRGFSAIAFGNGRFVVAQQYGVTMTSVDGLEWTWDQSQPRRSLTDVAWGNGQFMAAVQHGNPAVILTSTDGMTWIESPVPGTASPCAGAYGNGQYVAAYPDGAVYSSSDCVNWIERRPDDGNGLCRLAFGGGMFVAVGERGTVLTSRDGITWILNPSLTDRQLEDVLYAHGRFVIAGEAGTIMSASLPDSYGLPYVYGGPAFTSFTVYYPMSLPAGSCVYPVKYYLAPAAYPATDAVEALLMGLPGVERMPFVRLPDGARLLDLEIGFEDGICTVDFSQEIQSLKAGPGAEDAVVSAIVRTLTQFQGIESVRILVAGKPVDTLAGSVDVSEPLTSGTNLAPVFAPLADVADHWAGGAVSALETTGAIGGYPDGTFRPEVRVSRAEFVKMLVEALSLPPADSSSLEPFKDTAGHWSDPYIARAIASGLMRRSGYGDFFRPDEVIPREEMATLLVAASGIYRESQPGVKYETVAPAPSFSDIGSVQVRHASSVTESARLGLLRGFPDGTFRPKSGLTRAEAATAIARLLGMQSTGEIVGMIPRAGLEWDGGSLLTLGAALRSTEAEPGIRVTPTGGATILQDRIATVEEPGWGPLGVYLDGTLLADQSPASSDLFMVDATGEREHAAVSLPLDAGQAANGGEWYEVTDTSTMAMLWNDYLYDLVSTTTFGHDPTETTADTSLDLLDSGNVPFIFRKACRDGAFSKAGITDSNQTTKERIVLIIQEYAKRYFGRELDDPWIMPLGPHFGWDWLGQAPEIPPLNTRDRGLQGCSLSLKSVTRSARDGRYTVHLVEYARTTASPFEYLTYVLEQRPDGSLRFVSGTGSLARSRSKP